MSTPIKPPGHTPPPGGAGATDGPQPGAVEGRAGELRSLVEESQAEGSLAQQGGVQQSGDRAQADATGASAQTGASRVSDVQADLAGGRIDVDEAVERLVDRALANASDLPPSHRAALEAQLRAALAEDPTLVALRKDLERASQR